MTAAESSAAAAASCFPGVVLVVAPHMDDELLACGATLAALPDKQSIHVVYATDGTRSPVPERLGKPRPVPELADIRKAEAVQALAVLGIPAENAVFLGLPDGELRRHGQALGEHLAGHIARLQPDHVFAPFRLDRHPDHLAVHRATLRALQAVHSNAAFHEYFVYFRWRLLPGGDVRKLIRSDLLTCLPVTGQAEVKRRALACYASQTTRYYPWQRRAILAAANLEEVCSAPECFLRTAPGERGARVFARLALWARCAHVLEPRLKRAKELGKAILQRQAGSPGGGVPG